MKLENEPHIIEQAQKGNPDYFGLLYDHYLAPIYRFIYLKVNTKEEAQDLVHEVFLSAWKNLEDFDQQGHPFSSWLYQIARHKVIDHYRTKKVDFDIENVSEDLIKVTTAFDKEFDRQLDIKQVQEAITHLGEEQQSVLIMRFVEDLNYEEISYILNKSAGAIRLIQHRAIQNLKKIINIRNGKPNQLA
jgi:RNA polymerase sigma-70 factor (ECF subfamily)